MIDLTPIVNALITLLGLLLTTFLIPWIRVKVSAEKLEQVKKWTSVGVKAAEMIYRESGMGEAKKKYVRKFLESKGYKLDIDTVDALIEATVREMQQGAARSGRGRHRTRRVIFIPPKGRSGNGVKKLLTQPQTGATISIGRCSYGQD